MQTYFSRVHEKHMNLEIYIIYFCPYLNQESKDIGYCKDLKPSRGKCMILSHIKKKIFPSDKPFTVSLGVFSCHTCISASFSSMTVKSIWSLFHKL